MTPDPLVGFPISVLTGEQEKLSGRLDRLSDRVSHNYDALNAKLDGILADARESRTQAAENNSMLHEMRERSSGLARIHQRLEQGGVDHSHDVKALQLTVAEWKGAVKMLILVVTLVGTVVGGYITIRFDNIERTLLRLDNRIDKIPGAPP